MAVLDVIRNIAAALLIAAFSYWLPILGDRLLATHLEPSFQRTTLADRSGYLFVFDNYDPQKLDFISVAVDGTTKIKSASTDSVKPIDMSSSPAATVLTIHDLLPRKRTNLFLETDSTIVREQLKVYNDKATFAVVDSNVLYKSLYELPLLIYACLLGSIYFVFSLYFESRMSSLNLRIKETRVRTH